MPNVDVVGVDCHIGSQLTSLSPFVDALARVREYLDRVLVGSLQKEGAQIRYLDLGGGLGINYNDETPPQPEEYARAIIEGLEGLDVTLILEPGRVIVGNAGILVTEVQYVKENEAKNFVIVDGGMNDLIRPALYGSYQAIQPVVETRGREDRRGRRRSDLRERGFPRQRSRDHAAATRRSIGSHERRRLRLYDGIELQFSSEGSRDSRRRDKYYIVRKRESFEDLISGEVIPAALQ